MSRGANHEMNKLVRANERQDRRLRELTVEVDELRRSRDLWKQRALEVDRTLTRLRSEVGG